jgi:hypothetical protein
VVSNDQGCRQFLRYAEVAHAANGRLLNTLARVPLTGEATPELDALCRPGTATGTRVAAFNPIHPDTANLFAAVLSGDFTINGFRNRDLQEKLYPAAAKDAAETKRHRTSRLIAKLRGHGLITRVKNSRLYRLTARGLKAMPFASVVSTFPVPSGKPKPHETSALMSIPGEELHKVTSAVTLIGLIAKVGAALQVGPVLQRDWLVPFPYAGKRVQAIGPRFRGC